MSNSDTFFMEESNSLISILAGIHNKTARHAFGGVEPSCLELASWKPERAALRFGKVS